MSPLFPSWDVHLCITVAKALRIKDAVRSPGRTVSPACVVGRMSRSWRQLAADGDYGELWGCRRNSREGWWDHWAQNGDCDTVLCHQAQVISCEKSISFDSVSMYLPSLKFRWWPEVLQTSGTEPLRCLPHLVVADIIKSIGYDVEARFQNGYCISPISLVISIR